MPHALRFWGEQIGCVVLVIVLDANLAQLIAGLRLEEVLKLLLVETHSDSDDHDRVLRDFGGYDTFHVGSI